MNISMLRSCTRLANQSSRISLPTQLRTSKTELTCFNKGKVNLQAKRAFQVSLSLRNENEGKVPETPKEEAIITEKPTGNTVKHEFQAETRKLLDIVARSLYTDKEVFVRELVSNSSDALEKARHLQLAGESGIADPEQPFEVNIYTDPHKKVLVIQDSGIGMTDTELVNNLGNIGHSGSLDFIKSMKEKGGSPEIIGQFGVGFYSVFMVATKVTVYSRSATPGSKGYCWVSDGSGSYEISEADGVSRGTKIVIELNEGNTEFSSSSTIERIIKKYSSFVGFPIKLNGKQVNTIKALWTLSKNQITPEEHTEFYKFIARAYDEPMYHLHYSTDSPINIRSLFYVGKSHNEKFGLGRLESGISLFSRKVLIQDKADLLPDYLRFLKGVVDSEDLPLNLSREHLQDSALIKRIGNVLTKRILKWFEEEARKDPQKYNQFFDDFGNFFKEGIFSDMLNREELAKLLRVESSATAAGQYTSFDEYIERMAPDQKEIFFLCVPSRSIAETSPYYEAFKSKNKEVLFLYSSMDDFVMTSLQNYRGKKFVSAESQEASQALKDGSTPEPSSAMNSEEVKSLVSWFKQALESKVSNVSHTDRLVDSPAIIVDHESAAFRRMMKYVDPQRAPAMPKQSLEINSNHPVMQKLNAVKENNPELAKMIAEQIYDDALVTAGLLEDARVMMPRLNKILAAALENAGRKL